MDRKHYLHWLTGRGERGGGSWGGGHGLFVSLTDRRGKKKKRETVLDRLTGGLGSYVGLINRWAENICWTGWLLDWLTNWWVENYLLNRLTGEGGMSCFFDVLVSGNGLVTRCVDPVIWSLCLASGLALTFFTQCPTCGTPPSEPPPSSLSVLSSASSQVRQNFIIWGLLWRCLVFCSSDLMNMDEVYLCTFLIVFFALHGLWIWKSRPQVSKPSVWRPLVLWCIGLVSIVEVDLM